MKKIIVLIFLLFTIGCSNDTNVMSSSEKSDVNNSNLITVTGPMTLSRNDLYPFIQKSDLLSLQLVKGKYAEDWTPSPFMGRIWSGEFDLVIADENGAIKHVFQLSNQFSEPLIFNELFEIEFDDYNGDGDIDFTIGQYGTSNGNYYKLFTITEEEQIKQLQVKGYQELFISNGTTKYSTKLEKVSNISFTTTRYDNSIGKDVKDIFVWNGKEFVKSDTLNYSKP